MYDIPNKRIIIAGHIHPVLEEVNFKLESFLVYQLTCPRYCIDLAFMIVTVTIPLGDLEGSKTSTLHYIIGQHPGQNISPIYIPSALDPDLPA
jgi:hypothetical protein